MALPVIKIPEFSCILPSTNEEIRFRPFLVKEQKVLLLALEGEDETEILNAVQTLVKDCVLSNINIDKLPFFDFEYLFMKIRSKSIGEVIKLKMKHQKTVNKKCKQETDIVIDLDEITINMNSKKNDKIMITDDIGVKLRYPTIKDNKQLMKIEEDTIKMFKMVSTCIEYVFDQEKMYESNQTEIEDWLLTLNTDQFEKIINFFKNIPKLEYTKEWTCEKCGKSEKLHIEGFQNFFI